VATVDFTKVPSSVPITEENVQRLFDRSAEAFAAYVRRIESLQATLAEAKARFNADAEAFVAGTNPESRSQAAQLSKQRLAQQVITYQRSLVTNSHQSREEYLAVLRVAAEQAEAIQAVARGPIALLGRVALGEARRGNLIQQMSGAGPVELEVLARQAVMTDDLVLGSAIAAVVGARSKADQPFSPVSLAERLLGEVYARIAQKLKTIVFNYRAAFQADQTFANGKAKTIDSITLALARRDLAASEGATA
jgi:hypothetical protein